jgi:hypothetical protein
VGLLLEPEPPHFAQRLACVGVGFYLLGTRAFLRARRNVPGVLRVLAVVATFGFDRLVPGLSAHAYLWALTAWLGICAVLTTRTAGQPQPEAETA